MSDAATLGESPQEFVFTARHEFYYSTRNPVPVADVVEALLGLERLFKMSPKALTGLTGVDIEKVEVFVEEIEAGSLIERVLIKFFFKDEKGLDEFIEKVSAQMGETPKNVLLVSAVVLAMLYMGGELLAGAQGSETVNINASNNTIINIGAGEVKMTPEAFEAVVRAALPEKKELAKATIQVLKPTRSDPEASLVLDDSDELVMSPAAIREVPVEFSPGEDLQVERMQSAELMIRATNRDSAVAGWTVRLPSRFKRKLKLVLSPDINPEAIASHAQVKGDIDIQYRRSPDGKKYVPEMITLLRVIE